MSRQPFTPTPIYRLQVLYRLKEKGQLSDAAVKAPRHGQDLSHPGPPDSAQRSKGTKVSNEPVIFSSVYHLW